MAYVQANFNCITQEIVRPDKPVPFPDLNLPTPDPDSNDDLPDEDGPYDERERKPPDSYRDWWYHSDHLGSSTYLTDNFGRPSHYYETLPFGEMIVEHNQSTYNGGQYDNAYKFNGKELDEATQMYYYGARYYDPRISIFVSVDPLAEQFVGWTPYHYVHNNPINLIDPTGMSAENGDGGGFWNKLKSFIGISSTEKPTQYADDGSEILDEVVVSANRKPNWVQRNFSKDKLVNDWKNIKERSGANHLVNWFKNQNYDGGYYMYDDSGEASGDQSLKKQPHPTKPLEAINVGGFTQAGSFAKVGVGIGNIKSVAAPMNAVNNTLSGMSLGASTVEPTKELINSVKVWLFNGAQDSTLINLTPEQNMKLRDYQSIEGHRFRDSLKKESYFNTYK